MMDHALQEIETAVGWADIS